MGLSIHLLGKPFVTRDGERLAPPRGRKAWGLLTYLALTEAAHSREHLSFLLFSDADDPLGAVRWNLAEIRKLIGDGSMLRGDLVHLSLPPGTYVDVSVVTSGTWIEALDANGLGKELLEGMSFAGSPSFEAWLLAERRHQQGAAEAILREAALARLSSGDSETAIDLAARLVAMAPFEEPYQELLVRAYAVSGDRQSAQRQLAACIELYRRELGVEPGVAVFAAADAPVGTVGAPGASVRAAARAQLEAGRAALDAGVIDAGIDCLRRAGVEARAAGDLDTRAEALTRLGSALVHMVRGCDERGAAVLHEAITIAEDLGRCDLTTWAHRELAWIEVLCGRYERGIMMMERALQIAPDEQEEGRVELIYGAALTETGRYGEARRRLDRALEIAERFDDPRAQADIHEELGRVHVMRGDLRNGRTSLERAIEIARASGYNSFVPLPEGFLGMVDALERRDLARAEEALEHAFAFGCQMSDPCAESAAGHGIGLLAEARGDAAEAVRRLDDARSRCARRPDSSVWIQAWALDSLCRVAIESGDVRATAWVADLEALAGRCGMRDFLARAFVHRAMLGDPDAVETAEMLAAEVDSPALRALVERVRV